ncbi:endonuclease domain-containing protein [Niabella ginsengisoli]|uniref:Endonuclease domain-containing protein n=1 Tax=Niabella ginsengisoli TaxID=522298 RepID=A0ABS9SDS3_9BACT|nr:endonuclease domain-containing protein [Niabella ginsengisoli]
MKTKPLGLRFRRQHPYAIYILDFYCHALKLAIEVDGSIHLKNDVKENDAQRQTLLESDGLKVLRFTNEEIEKHLEKVIATIEEYINNGMENSKNIISEAGEVAHSSPSGLGVHLSFALA